MKGRYNLVVFDWEGTLAEDSYGQIVSVIAKEVANFEISGFDKILARKYIPLGLTTMVSKLFPSLNIQQQEKLLGILQESLHNSSEKVTLTENADATVKKIFEAGIKLGIATNRSLSSLQKVLSLSGLEQYFQVLRTASQAPAKPCPDMLEEIIFECDASNDTTLMIGDSLSDIEMAVAIGVDAVGVDFYHEQQGNFVRAGACLEIDNYLNLLKFLSLN